MKVKAVLSLAVLLTSLLSYSSGFKIPNGPVGGSQEKTWQKLFKVPNSPKKPFEDILRARGINYRSPRKTKILSDPSNSPFPVPSFHGYVPVRTSGTDDIFYWMFPAQNDPDNAPLLIWLNGGPGCSSEIGLFFELGPFNITLDNKVVLNPESWNKNANLLFVDQPIGVGFSHTTVRDMCQTEESVAADFAEFLTYLLQNLFPNLISNKVYIAGESYAGNYIPFIASHLLDLQLEYLNLAGIAIGNGWTHPAVQYANYANFSLDPANVGYTKLSQQTFDQVNAPLQSCQNLIDVNYPTRVLPMLDFCEGLNSEIYLNQTTQNLLFNLYDIRMECSEDDLCYDMTAIYNYINSPAVLNQLQADKYWEECSDDIFYSMNRIDANRDVTPQLAKILNADIPVLIYYGDKDYICNWFGGITYLKGVAWKHQQDFLAAATVPEGDYGESMTAANLKFLRVFNAGHMVPTDQPEAARQMIESFMQINPEKSSKKTAGDLTAQTI